MTAPRLARTATGYTTPDRRWLIEAVRAGGGALTTRGGDNSRWSDGRREWRVTDTHGKVRLGTGGPPHTTTVRALYEVRDIIAFYERA